MPIVTFTSGPLAGRRVEIDGDVVIGREAADLIIENPEISRRHAILRSAAGGVAIEDLSSRNGTFIDDVRIDGAALVPDGATVRFGPVAMVVSVETTDPGATRVSPVPAPGATRISEPAAAPRSDPVTAIEEIPPAPAAEPPPTQPPAPAPAPTQPPAPAPVAAAPPAPAAPPVAAAAGGGAGLAVDQPFGAFQPPSRRRHRGVATRLWLPAAVSFAVIVATAAALVIYFAGR